MVTTGGPVPAGLRYTVVSQVPVYDVKRLQYAPAADDPAMTALPRTDAAGQPIGAINTFTRTAAAATAGSSFPYEQAVRLADWLRRSYRFDPTALPGHTYRQLEFFLTSGKRGTSEQFAAAFAVLARTLGLPARVAVGFRHGTRGPDGAWQVPAASQQPAQLEGPQSWPPQAARPRDKAAAASKRTRFMIAPGRARTIRRAVRDLTPG